MSIRKAIKKPIPVEFIQFKYSDEGIRELKNFCGDNVGRIVKNRSPNAIGEAEILTLEDGRFLKVNHIASEGDYILKGYANEFWAVKPEIFEATYNIIEDIK